MPKDFSFESVRKICKKCKLISKQLSATLLLPYDKLSKINKLFSYLKRNGYFLNAVDYEIDHDEQYPNRDGFNMLLYLIEEYLEIIPLMESVKSIKEKYEIETRDILKNISPAKNAIRWFFASNIVKRKAIEQIDNLTNFFDSGICLEITNAVDKVNNISNGVEERAFVNFKLNTYNFIETILKANKKAFRYEKYSIEKIRELENAKNELKKLDAFFNKEKDNLVNLIREEIRKLVDKKTNEFLRSIPIDEFSKEKKGIRVKSLKDAGYRTMADVMLANYYEIKSVYGIGDDMAYTIKASAERYASEAKKTIKIKITTDDKNVIATRIVTLVYLYKNAKQSISDIYEKLNTGKNKIDEAFKKLKTIDNGTMWPFISNEERNELIDSYAFLKNTLESEKILLAKKVLDDYAKNRHSAEDDAWNDFKNNSIDFYNIIEKLCPGVLGNGDTSFGLSEELFNKIKETKISTEGLRCSLRKYQELGVKYILRQEKVLLGDEMGLGKTVEAIATMVSLMNDGAKNFVVVCPAGVLINWYREIKKHSDLAAYIVHGADANYEYTQWKRSGGVAIMTYESTSTVKSWDTIRIDQIVVDEAHYIKNPNAARSERARMLCERSNRVLLMTGTALENKVEEMIELVSILRKDVAIKLSKISFMTFAPEFRREAAKVYYRRKREDVLSELPDLIQNEEWCKLSDVEEMAYENAILAKNFTEARRVSWNIGNINRSTKATRLLEIIEDAKNDGRKVIVFSFFLDTIEKIKNMLGDVCVGAINGSIAPQKRQEIIDKFSYARSGSVLCSQILSGGTGLNIQSASVVVICEPQFKPSTENQAISRAYRMGQSRNVHVFRLLCENTIDEKITKLLEKKQMVFNAFADKSVAAEKDREVNDEDFNKILKEEYTRISNKHHFSNTNTMPKENNNSTNNDINMPVFADEFTCVQKLNMSYDALVKHLLTKYGPVNGDYFLTPSCKTKNPSITRGSEGLFVHHIDENKAILLSTPEIASLNPFGYQRADRLVYCDVLEHLILHILIAEESNGRPNDSHELVGIGGAAEFICRQINDCYSGRTFKQKNMVVIKEQIKDKFEDYILILQKLYNVIKGNPIYSEMYSKEKLCSDYDGQIVNKIFNRIK